MFEFIRTHQRLMQFVLLLLIVPSFAFFGLESYTRMGDEKTVVAKVAGQSITQQQWDIAQDEQMNRLRQMFGAQFDSKMFETPEAKQNVLNNLIAQRALAAEAARQHISISDQALQQEIMGISDLKAADGKFDHERYKTLLANQGLTPVGYEARFRQELMLQKLNGAVQATAFLPKAIASRISEVNDQEREVQQLLFKSADYLGQVKVTDAMLKDYYEKNDAQFSIPEQAQANYVILSRDEIAKNITVADTEIKAFYDQNKKRYGVEEQRRASHILINVKKGASDAEKTAAKAKIESLLAQARKDPASFAKLAKDNSEDSGSAAIGGDLDFFGKGMMVKPFEDVAYKLKQGEISDVVKTEFGYHIIQLTEVKPGSIKSLDSVKAEIAAELKNQQAGKKYAEQAEIFGNMVYEQSESLKPVADKLGLQIQSAAELTRTPNPKAAPDAPFNHPKFLKALFSDEAVKNKRNTDVVEIAPNTLIAGHIVSYKPVTKRPFDEVKAAIRERVTAIEADRLAQQAGVAKLEALKTKDESAGFSTAKNISRIKLDDINPVAATAVLTADTNKLPAYVGVELPEQGYAVYRINKVSAAAKPDTARRLSEQQQAASVLAQQEAAAYIEVLKAKAKAKILKPIVSETTPTDAKS